MDDSKTMMVNSFGVVSLSGTRAKRKTSVLNFSLARRLLLAGTLLLGMVFSAPIWGIPLHPPNVITHNLNLETDSLAVKEGTSSSFRIGVPSPGLDAFFGLKFKLASGSNSGALEFDIDPNTPGNQHFLTVWESQSVSVQVQVTATQDANRINEVVEVGFSIWDHPENALINPHHQKTVYLNSQKVVVTAIDDDDPAVGLKLSRTSITMDEGSSETFTVRLKSKPYNTRIVNLYSTNSDVTVNKTALTFTTSNWNQAQTVTVRAAHDDDGVNDIATINLTGSKINTASVGVTVIDDDVGLSLSLSSLMIVEGGSKTFRAKLAKNPGGNRTVALASTNTDVTVNKTSLTFTASNWNTYQTVRVYAAHDSDSVDDTARINLTGAGVATGSVNVMVIDDDVELILSASSLTIPEGGSRTFTVKLGNWPGNSRTINLTSINSDVTVDTNPSATGNQTTLTFTASNWSTARTVRVRVAHDSDKTNDSAVINLTGSGVVSGSVLVNVIDDDVGLILSSSSLTIPEGGSSAFTVRLGNWPGNSRTINLTSSNSDVTVDANSVTAGNQTSLTFTASNWSTPRTVQIRAAHDTDKLDETATINLTGTGVIADSVNVTVIDDDKDELVLSSTSLTMNEGQSKTFSVKLSAQPSAGVTITLTRTGSGDVTFDTNTATAGNQNTLAFTTSNWNTAQSVTVRAAIDADKLDETATINLTGTGVATGSVNVTVIDDDVRLTLSVSSLTIQEGGSRTFTVKLGNWPGNSRTINLSSTNSDVTVDTNPSATGSQTSLTFTASNWSTPRTVRVRAAHDSDKTNDSAVINLTGSGVVSGSVRVNVIDDDDHAVSLTLSASSLKILEGSSKTFTVRLAERPGKGRTVNLSSSNSDVTVDANLVTAGNQTSLIFTASNWNTAREVTVSAAHDTDKLDETATISLTGTGITAGSVNVAVTDDDKDELVLSSTSLKVSEGRTNTFTVKLAKNPGSTRTVTLTSDNAEVTVDAQSTVFGKQNSLTFTSSNWNQTQTVTVYAAQDDDKVDDAATINLTGTGVAVGSVEVKVLDDDVGLRWSNFPSTIQEGGSENFTVRLDKWPGNNRTINLSSSNSDVTFDADPNEAGNQTSMTLTASNWNTGPTVTVSAAHDADKTNDNSITYLTMSESGFSYLLQLTVIDDDDVAVGLTLSESTLPINEGGTKTFTVKLAVQPGKDRTVSLSSNNSDVTVDVDTSTPGNQTTLTFTASNWNAPQPVTVTAAHDDDEVDDTATINLAGTGITSSSVEVQVLDDDISLRMYPSPLTMKEGETKTIAVKLFAKPKYSRTLTINVASTNSDVMIDTDYFTPGIQTSLSFDSDDWSIPHVVNVTAAQDEDTANNEAIINLTGTGFTDGSVTVKVTDDEIGLTLSKTELTMEEGGTATFTVKLDKQPGSDQMITLSSNNTDVTVSPTTLTFTGGDTGNWDTEKTVTLTAAHDEDTTNDKAVINLTGVGVVDGSVDVTVTDDDIGLILSKTELTMDEGGNATFTVKLAEQPGKDRTVNLSSDNSDVTVDVDTSTPGNQTTLIFTASNWSTAREVTVSAAHDTDKTDDTATINLTGTGVTAGTVTVNVTDDDDVAVGLTLSSTSLTIEEGRTATFKVKLAEQPGKDRTVNLSSSTSYLTVDTDTGTDGNQTTLTFAAASWNIEQTVTLTAAHDKDKLDETATINLAGTGTGTDIIAGSVAVTVLDDDIGLTLSKTELTMDEGGSDTFTVKLDAEPRNNRTINLSSTNSDVTVDRDTNTAGNQTTLNFTSANWNAEQTVTVTAAQDTDKTDDTATINLTGTGFIDGAVTVNVTDDDDVDVGLEFSVTELTINEGDTATIGVKLATQPGKDRTVNLLSNNPDVTVRDTDVKTPGDQAALLFTAANWSTEQTVTVAAAHDGDIGDDIGMSLVFHGTGITLSVVDVTVIDDDDVAVGLKFQSPVTELAITELTVNEGSTATFKVRLAAPIGKARTVNLSSNNPDVTFDTDPDTAGNQTTLNFSVGGWNRFETVTVSAAHDADNTDDTVTISLTGTGVTDGSMTVKVIDDDVGLTLSATSLTIQEGGDKTFKVKLDAWPGNSRTVTLSSTHSDVTVDTDAGTTGRQTTLTFAADNWSTEQTVTLIAVEDGDLIDETAMINLSVNSIVSASVSVSVSDNDMGLILLSATSLTLQEGHSGSFRVKLSHQTSENVTVTVKQPSNTDVTVDTNAKKAGNQNTLSFTASNWSTYQTVHVNAAVDPDESNDSAGISLKAAGGEYDAKTGKVAVTVNENFLVLSTDTLTLVEGTGSTFTVMPGWRPSQAKNIAVVIGIDFVTVDTDPGTPGNQVVLTFTSSNWNMHQTVTVNAADDTNRTDESGSLFLGELVGGRSKPISVKVLDDDIGMTLLPTSLMMDEGASKTFTVQLSQQPGNDRKITLSTSNSDVTFSPAELSFSVGKWKVPLTVTVSAADDADQTDDSATINLEGAGLQSSSVTVTVTDDDKTAGLSLSAISPTVKKKGAGIFAVRLGAQSQNGQLIVLSSDSYDAISGAGFGDTAVLAPPSVQFSFGHRVSGLGFSDGRVSVSSINADLYFAQSEQGKDRSNHDGSGQQFDRRRPEDRPHRIPRERDVSLGFDHRRRHPIASV